MLVALRRREWVERECCAIQAALDVCDQAVAITDVARGERRMNRSARALLARLASPWTLDDELTRARERGERATVRAEVQLVDGTRASLRTKRSPPPPTPASGSQSRPWTATEPHRSRPRYPRC